MRNWLKQQVTEMSAWAGIFLIFAPFVPYWACWIAGALLISTNDTQAADLVRKVGAFFGKKIDNVNP